MTRTVKAMLFDLDGTLLDHDTAATTALTQALRATPGLDDVDHAQAGRRWQELEEAAMNRYLSGQLTFTEQRRLRVISLAAELGLGNWNTTKADAWFANYLNHYESVWSIYPDVRPMLDALNQHHPHLLLGVLTNGDAEQQRKKLETVGLDLALPHVIASSEVGAAKPNPKIFQQGCARLGLPPDEIAYIGDRLHTDALAATNAGLLGIWLNRTGTPTPDGPPTIRTLKDLPTLLADPNIR
ncbi:HAD family hydrolase [Lentzea nigeriaca]|uniref:HAD family hydrolase n=1 Tax=Lentzea nigeriaca TaxID=1128665 RepID=UPI00195A4F39|nr:HAD family hydrolase [Lentzea nigeriaca]MBM7856300.1 putative hydrolase of the HAD superfamily [Lentzea nigeriaca]